MMRLLSFIFASVILASVSGAEDAPISLDEGVRAQNHSIAIGEVHDDVMRAVSRARVAGISDSDCKFQYRWEFAASGTVPSGAVGSKGKNGKVYYVARSPQSNDLIPGTLDVTHNRAYVSHGGSAFAKKMYQVLVSRCVRWEYQQNGNVPDNAIIGGSQNDNSFLYIGKTSVDNGGEIVFGKIVPLERVMYYPYNGKEHSTRSFDVLVADSNCNYTL